VLGDFSWDERGLPHDRPFLLVQWQNRKIKYVYPAAGMEGVSPIIYPKPKW
jgi:branched-chain amino acid transport system substrate-binding protein